MPSKTYKMIEIGVNLTDPMFRGNYREKQVHEDDMEQVIERAKNVGVTKMLVTGGNLEESLEAINLCKKYPNYLFSTVGCHPTRCNEFLNNPEDYLNKLSDVIENNLDCVAAIGEFGLDYDRLHFCEAEVQKKYFELQFNLSEKFKLPLFLHCRNTGTDFATIIKANRHRFADGVVHSFTGSYEEAKELIDLGLYIGINGCSMKTAENLEVIKKLPVDKLMIETDAPWCDIRPTHASYEFIKNHEDIPEWKVVKKEKFQLGSLVKSRNEPCQLISVLVVLSKLFDMELEPLSEILYNNTLKVFEKLK